MIILGIETTGNILSVAVSNDSKILGEYTINHTQKHSVTLMPAIRNLLCSLETDMEKVDLIAVSIGPGSFTGIRIGAATAKGLAHALKIPVAQIDTLDGLIQNVFFDGTICAIMNARQKQVYTAARCKEDVLVASCAIEIASLMPMLGQGPVLFVGDGIDEYAEFIRIHRPDSIFANEAVRYQHAASICELGFKKAKKGKLVMYNEVQPNYLRESQAERLRVKNEKYYTD